MMDSTVFVYGTLKRGFANNVLLCKSKYLGEHTTPKEFTMINLGWYPGVLESGNTAVHGEVWQMSDTTMEQLDWLEGYPTLYVRKRIPTPFGEAWMYVYNGSLDGEEAVITEGVWI